MKTKDLTGFRHGRLVAIKQCGKHKNGRPLWLCICDCGNEILVSSQGLAPNSGSSRSCGCILLEKNRSRPNRGPTNKKHGESQNRTGEYVSWISMKQRCHDEKHSNYTLYGAKGVSVCDRWRNSFENFLADMGRKKHTDYSIDRIDPKGDYEPGNCRWASQPEQQSNRTNNRFAVVFGVRRTCSETARETGIPERTIFNWANKIFPSEDISDLVSRRISRP